MKNTDRQILRRPATLLAAVLGALVALTLAPQSARAQTANPFDALPESEAVIVVNIRRILDEAVPRVLSKDPATLARMNDGLSQMRALSGIDIRSANRIVVGVRSVANARPDDVKAVIVMEMNDAEKLMSLIRSDKDAAAQLREDSYQGKSIFIMPKGAQSANAPATARKLKFDIAISVLDAGTILFGTPEEVRSAIDASAGRRARVSAEMVAAATRHANALFGMSVLVPPSLTSNLFGAKQTDGAAPENAIAKAVSSVKQVSAALGLAPAGFDVVLAGRTTTGDEAKNLGDMLNGLKALATMSAPKGEQERMLQGVVRGVDISNNGNEVVLSTLLTQEMVETFITSIKSEMNKAKPKSNIEGTTPATPNRATPARRTRRARRPPRG